MTSQNAPQPDGAEPNKTEQETSGDLPKQLSRKELFFLTLACAVVTANAYYIHPIIAYVGADFGVSDAMIGAVPALNQIALAIGIFLLLPLGDRVSNRKLVSVFTAGQFVGIAIMAFAAPFWLFTLGSTLLGFFTIAPYLLPTYVSKRVDAGELGNATALLTTGVIAGILLARAGAGIIGEYLGWRMVYYIASGLMLIVSVLLPFIMQKGEGKQAKQSFFSLLWSIGPIVRGHPEILISGAIQALGFGAFIALWLCLGFHLTSPEMGYGVDTVGYLALFALLNLVTTPRLGRWADKVGPHKARFRFTLVHLAGASLFGVLGHDLWLLMIPIVLTNVVGPSTDVTNRMTFLNQEPVIRTRLMTVYIVCMFLGGGLASWAGTTAYDLAGWDGTATLVFAMSVGMVCLSFLAARRAKKARKT